MTLTPRPGVGEEPWGARPAQEGGASGGWICFISQPFFFSCLGGASCQQFRLGGLCHPAPWVTAKQSRESDRGSPSVKSQISLRCLPLGPWVGVRDPRSELRPFQHFLLSAVLKHSPVSLSLPPHPHPLFLNWGRGEGRDCL